MRAFSIIGKITIFKTLAISKILHHSLITSVPAFIIERLNIIKKIIWQGKKPKVKRSFMQNVYIFSVLRIFSIK